MFYGRKVCLVDSMFSSVQHRKNATKFIFFLPYVVWLVVFLVVFPLFRALVSSFDEWA
jgi:predicted ABC-type exoprotein transport system permease subunit